MIKWGLFSLLLSFSLPSFAFIVGGSVVADPDEEAFYFVKVGKNCGGSLVSESYVLTAAHCVSYFQNYLHLLPLKLMNGESRKPLRLIVHPKYEPSSINFDFALIELDLKVSPERVIDLSSSAPGSVVTDYTAYGFGNTIGSNGDPFQAAVHSQVLKKITETFVPRSVANAERSYNGRVKEEMFAAGTASGLEGTCQGDSGGPLVYVDPHTLRPVLAGVVSWGEGCAVPYKYSVYGDVRFAAPWVQEITRP